MKLTEMQLLNAIGQADEKMISKTAPLPPEEQSGRRPIRIRQRALEMAAVCAALCIFVAGGFLIRNLYRSQEPLTSYTDDETAAREVMEQFMEACKSGDKEKILKLSLIEVVCRMLNDDNPEQAEEDIREYTDALSRMTSYQIGEFEDMTDRLDEMRQTERDLTDLTVYSLESLGKHEEAEQFRQQNAYLDFFSRSDKMFGFHISFSVYNEETENTIEEKDYPIAVMRYDGKWYAEPVGYNVPSVSEEGKKKLAEYRAKDPNYQGGTEQPVQTELPADSAISTDTPAKKAAAETLTGFLEICKTGDADQILANCLIDPYSQAAFHEPCGDETTLMNMLAGILDYELEAGVYDAAEELDERISKAESIQWREAWELEKDGRHEDAMKRLETDPLKAFLEQISDLKSCFVNGHFYTDGKKKDFGMLFYAGKYQGKWTALPFHFQPDEPEELSDAEQKEYLDFVRKTLNYPENDLPEFESIANWKTWRTIRTKETEPLFSGGEIPAKVCTIQLADASRPPAGGTALSLLVGPTHTGPYTVSFDFRMPDESPGTLKFVTYYGSNTVPDEEPYGEQQYWYMFEPNGALSYNTSFGHDSDMIRTLMEKNEATQCFDPKMWNTLTLKSSGKGVEMYINGTYAAFFEDKNGDRGDLTGRLALDGAVGIMFRNFVFTDGIS